MQQTLFVVKTGVFTHTINPLYHHLWSTVCLVIAPRIIFSLLQTEQSLTPIYLKEKFEKGPQHDLTVKTWS